MRLLVISPHPDDETLGAGGTLLKYKQQGNRIFWLNFTGMKKEYGYTTADVKKRSAEIERVNKIYKFDGFYNLKLKPNGLDEYPKSKLISKVSKIMNEVKPDMVILPFKNDVHSDHRVVFDIVYSCCKVFRYPYIKKILAMEILSETDLAASDYGFMPNYFVDATDLLEKKIEIMKIYKSEIRDHPFPRSEENIRALATYRGAAAGCKYAEGFILLKGIE